MGGAGSRQQEKPTPPAQSRSSQNERQVPKENLQNGATGMMLEMESAKLSRLSFDYSVDQDSSILCLPEEILQKIFTFVPGLDLVRSASLVCKYWYVLLNDNSFWRMRCKLEDIACPPRNSKIYDSLDFRHIYFTRPFNRNLVKNWNASEGFKHWNIEENGGNRFAVEPCKCPGSEPVSSIGIPDCSNCWVTSYTWCRKSQLISLLDEGCTEDVLDQLQPEIEITDWTAARFDCASEYGLEVQLLSANMQVLEKVKRQRRVQQWDNKKWHRVSHVFSSYPEGVRCVRLIHGGKDLQFWAGHYGPKITGTSVQLKI